MSLRARHLVFSMVLACFLLGPGGAGAEPAAGEKVVEIGRQFKAITWLEGVGDVPYAVVPFESIPLLAGMPMQTEYYQIDPEVVASAYSYFFCVRGKDAVYIAGSVANLAKLVRELAVLDEIRDRNKGKEIAGGVGDGLKGIGTGLVNLVVHPGLSLKSAGTRIRQTGRTIERAVGAEDKVGRDESGVDRSNLGDGPAGQIRRQLAYDLGIDVYTSNPVLRDALVELSQLRTAGSLTTWAIPYHIGAFSHFNPISGDEKTELRIRDFAPYELRRLIGEDLEPVFGMDREDASQPLNNLLMNPNFTPREIAYIGLDFEHLASADNLGIVLRRLAAADTPEEADMLSLEFRLYSFLHRRIEPIRAFVAVRNIFAALTDSGRMYLMVPADTIRPWDQTARAFAEILQAASEFQATGLELWTIGDIDPAMADNAARSGVVVRQNIFRDPQFFPAPEQKVVGQ